MTGPHEPHDPGQLPLFDVPAPPPRVAPRSSAPSARPSYTKYTPKVHRLCDDCVRDIHARGVSDAPFPSGVRWRRSHAGAVDLLCPRHKDRRMEADD